MSSTALNYNTFTQFPVGLRTNGGSNPCVYASVIDSNGRLIVAGSIGRAMDKNNSSYYKSISNVAIFDNNEWVTLGNGLNNTVFCLGIYSNNDIYAGGAFTASSSLPINRVAKWNGTSWTQVGPGLNNRVLCLQVLPNGHLVAGGEFTATDDSSVSINRIGIWNGSNWSGLGTGPSDPLKGAAVILVRNFKYYSGNLYVVGNFSKIDGIVVNGIAMWNGTSWSPVGNGFDDDVTCIDFDNAGNLFVGGKFIKSNDGIKTFNRVAMWNGTSWSNLSNGIINDVVGASGSVIGIKYIPNKNVLYVVHTFSTGTFSVNVQVWNGSSWQSDLYNRYFLLNRFIQDFDGTITTHKEFTYDIGFNDRVTKIRIGQNDDLIIAGIFTEDSSGKGSKVLNRIARLSSSNRQLYNYGPGVNGNVFALAVSSDYSRIVIGGNFTSSNSGLYDGINYNAVSMNRIGMWDGVKWNALGPGFNNIVFTVIFDKQGNLYAGGRFTQLSDGTPMNYIAKWNGNNWSQVGGGIYNGGDLAEVGVYTMEFDKYDNLIVGGPFKYVNDGLPDVPIMTANYLAGWNGTSWFRFKTNSPTQAVAYGFNNAVYTIDFDTDGNMAVGGSFTNSSGNFANNSFNRVAKFSVGSNSSWSDSICSSFNTGLNNIVEVIKYSADGYLYAGGNFTGNFNRFNGTTWETGGEGVNGIVYAMARNSYNDIIIGGNFTESTVGTASTVKRIPRIAQLLAKRLLRTTLSNFSIPSSKNVNSPPFTINPPTSNREGTFTYTSSNSSIASVSGNTITINNGGTVTITAIQQETSTYSAGTISAVLVIDKLTPTVGSFNVPSKIIGSPSFTLSNPTTNSNGTFSFLSSNPLVATILGNVVTVVGVGSTNIIATLSETNIYQSASSVSTFTVFDKTTTTLTNFLILNKFINDIPFTITSPLSNRPGTFTYSSSNNLVATTSGNVVTIRGSGTVTITANQAETDLYKSGSISSTFIVSKITPTITSFIIGDKFLGDPNFFINPRTTSNGIFSFSSSNDSVVTISGNEGRIIGAGAVTVTITVSETALYAQRSVTTSFNVYSPTTVNPSNVTSSVALITLVTTSTAPSLAVNSPISIPITNGNSAQLASTTKKDVVNTSTKPTSLKASKRR